MKKLSHILLLILLSSLCNISKAKSELLDPNLNVIHQTLTIRDFGFLEYLDAEVTYNSVGDGWQLIYNFRGFIQTKSSALLNLTTTDKSLLTIKVINKTQEDDIYKYDIQLIYDGVMLEQNDYKGISQIIIEQEGNEEYQSADLNFQIKFEQKNTSVARILPYDETMGSVESSHPLQFPLGYLLDDQYIKRITFTFWTKKGYRLKEVKVNGASLGKIGSYVVEVGKNYLIEPIWEEYNPATHLVKVTYSVGGSIKVNDQSVTSGQSVTVAASTDVKVAITPQTGYHIKQVQLGNEDVTSQLNNNLLVFSSISTNKDITVIFEKDTPITHSVKVNYSAGGSVKVNGQSVTSGQSATVIASSDVKVIITPQAGYHIKQVQLGNEDVTGQLSSNVLTISSISANKNIMVIFEKDTPIAHVVKITYSAGGSVKVNDHSVTSGQSATVTASTNVKVTITTQVGYHIKQVLLGNEDVTSQLSNNVLTVSSISEDKYIAVTFEKEAPVTHIVKVTCSYGGSVKVNDQSITSGLSVTVAASTDVRVTITPQADYRIQRVTLKGEDVTDRVSDNVLTISSISANEVLSITFEQIPTYELNISMTGGSSSIKIGDKVITESTRISRIKEGSSVFINFLPNKYYEIKKVTLENEDITTQIQDGFFEIKSVRSNLKLKVEYVQKKYTLSLTNSKGIEKISIYSEEFENVGSISLACGTSLLRILANSFYLIKQILSNGEVIYDASEENNRGSSYVELWINMDEDKELTVILSLREEREISLELEEPGTLASCLSDEDMKLTTNLFVKGKIDQRDLAVINQMQSLSDLNLGRAMIEQYNGYPANTIPEKAFYHNQNIQTMYLPHSLVAIDKQAFSGSVISSFMEDSESHKYLTKIGEEAFKNCQYLIKGLAFHLTNNLVIEKGAFENCTNLNLVGLPMNLVEIKDATFRNCKNLSITLESDLERIGDYAFENVKEIYNYDWVEDGNFKLSHIGTNALKGCKNGSFYLKNYPYLKELPCFEGCSNMNFITFPPNVKEISEETFKGCTSLQYVTMNEKIERIAENAFSDSRMTELYVPVNKTPEVYANSFNDYTYNLAKLLVPADQLPYYRIIRFGGNLKI